MFDYQTAPEAAQRWGVTRGRVHQLIAAGRIPGAVRAGRHWLIPRSAPYPEMSGPVRRKRA